MFSKRIFDRGRSLAVRLTVWYAGLFTLITLIFFGLFYFMIHSYTYGRIDGYLEAEIEETRLMLAVQGLDQIKNDIAMEETSHGENKIFFRLVRPDGSIISASDQSRWQQFPPRVADLETIPENATSLTTLTVPGDRYPTRVIRALIAPGVILEIGQTLKAEKKFMADIRHNYAVLLILGVCVASGVGWFMSRRALAGVRDVARTALNITGGDLNHRVPIRGTNDEIDRLAAIFNSMIDRIQSLIVGMKEINDNIAHDLRGPITRIRGVAETILTGPDSLQDYRAMAASTIEESDRLLQLVNTILDISEINAGIAGNRIVSIDLSRMMEETVELFYPVAEEQKIRLTARVPPEISIRGDIRKLQRAVSNLLDNALKNTPEGGAVILTARREGGRVSISVRDTGEGIPPDELPRIFDRFYRGKRTAFQEGNGLGLSLARAVIRSHGGDITVESAVGEGSDFTVTLPLSPSA